MAWLRKLWALIRGTRLDRELDEEMEFHLAMRTEAHRAAGLDEREAQHQARRQFGNRTVLKELTHDMNVSSWLQQFVQVISFTHLRYAWRLLWRAPALSWGAVLSLALGVGAATALFSIVDAVLLKPLPYRDADRLVTIALAFPPDTNTASSELTRRLLAGREATALRLLYELTAEDVRAVQARTDLFESVATFVLADHSLDVSDRALSDTDATVLRGGLADHRLFGTLGIRAALGRTFQEDDAQRDVVVISDSVWKSHFGADPAVVGRPLRLAKGPRTIIGVLPAGIHLTYPEETEFWLPLSPVFVQGQRNGNPFSVIARLRPRVSASQASAALDIGTIGLTLGPVRRPTAPHVEVQPLHEQVSGSARPALVLMSATAALMLLIAYANTSVLLLTRATRRVKETVLRAAIGASSGRLLAEALIESTVVGGLGITGGVLFAAALHPLIRWAVPPTVPRIDELVLDTRALAFATSSGMLCAVVAGVASQRVASRLILNEALTQAAQTATTSLRGSAWRRALMMSQAALMVPLLVATVLLAQSFWRVSHVRLGFETDGIVAFDLYQRNDLAPPREDPNAYWARFRDSLRQSLSDFGSGNVALVNSLPFVGAGFTTLPWGGRPAPTGAKVVAREREITPEFFDVVGMKLLAGRPFAESDMSSNARVMILSASLARALFGGQSPIGQPVDFREPYEVVGVVNDVRWIHPTLEPEPTVYYPYNRPLLGLAVLVRSNLSAPVVSDQVRKTIWSIYRGKAITAVSSMDDVVARANEERRFQAISTTSFGVLALLLGSIGTWATVMAAVTERVREMGIRSALGATSRELVRFAMRQAVRPIVVGIAIGTIGAFWTARLLTRFLFEVSVRDPLSFGTAVVLVLVVALLAAWLPSRAAVRLNPLDALRQQ